MLNIKKLKYFIFLIRYFFNVIKDKNFYFKNSKSQNKNQESLFLKKISNKIKKKTFLEIGFHYNQFNCIGLIKKGFKGTLIDGGKYTNITIMRLINFLLNLNLKIFNTFLTKKNIKNIEIDKKIGCLSIDIDGNDYWILKELLNYTSPEIIIAEYNASFQKRSISVPYDPKFIRHEKHPSGWYHGVSLNGLTRFHKKKNYYLIKVIGGLNAIFASKEFIKKNNLKSYSAKSLYAENQLRNQWSNTDAKMQYKKIKYLKYVRI
jgi:hypothetical protein